MTGDLLMFFFKHQNESIIKEKLLKKFSLIKLNKIIKKRKENEGDFSYENLSLCCERSIL